MYTLLVTDLDDTLYNWIDFFIPSFVAMAEEVSAITHIPMPTLLAEYKMVHHKEQNVESPYATLQLPSVRACFWGEDELAVKRKLQPAFDAYNRKRDTTLVLYEGVNSTLKALKEQGVAIVGYTEAAKENGWYRLEKLGVSCYFDRLYVPRATTPIQPHEPVHIATERKPSPATLLRICSEMGKAPSEVLYVGDSLTKDVYMAKQAGVKVAQMLRSQPPKEHIDMLVAITSWTEADFLAEAERKEKVAKLGIKADYIVSNYSQLLPLFLG